MKTFHSLRQTVINHAEHKLGIDVKIIVALVGYLTDHKLVTLTTQKNYLMNKPVDFLKTEITDKLIYGPDMENL